MPWILPQDQELQGGGVIPVVIGYIVSGVIVRVLCLYTLRFIQTEGGWSMDSGSHHCFYPDLPYERSILTEGSWHGSNERMETFIWVMAIIGWPLCFMTWMILFPFPLFSWFLNKIPPMSWKGK